MNRMLAALIATSFALGCSEAPNPGSARPDPQPTVSGDSAPSQPQAPVDTPPSEDAAEKLTRQLSAKESGVSNRPADEVPSGTAEAGTDVARDVPSDSTQDQLAQANN